MHWTRFFAFFVVVFLLLSHADAMAPLGADGLSGETPSVLLQVKNKKNKHNDHSNGDSSSSGERSCPEGYVVLKEKNKYGAFCEPTPKEEKFATTCKSEHEGGAYCDKTSPENIRCCCKYKVYEK